MGDICNFLNFSVILGIFGFIILSSTVYDIAISKIKSHRKTTAATGKQNISYGGQVHTNHKPPTISLNIDSNDRVVKSNSTSFDGAFNIYNETMHVHNNSCSGSKCTGRSNQATETRDATTMSSHQPTVQS